jgi:hypothetical protein
MAHELSRVVDALPGVDHGDVETRVAGDPWEEDTMKTVASPIPFAGSQLGEARHVCAFFHNPDEEYRVLLPFITEGFACGDRSFHVVDPTLREAHLRRLASAGIDVAVAAPSGQLTLHDWYDAHLRQGHFDQHGMIAYLEAQLQDGPRQGFRLSRAIGHMEWALEDRAGCRGLSGVRGPAELHLAPVQRPHHLRV